MKLHYALLGTVLMCASCSWSNSQIKPFAPIKKSETYKEARRDDDIRKAILEQCPLGTTREEALDYIRKNFWTLGREMHPKGDIYFRIHEGGTFPVGSNWTDVGFKFDAHNRLRDVYVDDDQVYL